MNMRRWTTFVLFCASLWADEPDKLFQAIRNGDHSQVTRLIRGKHLDLSKAGASGLTPLLQAIVTSDAKMVRPLIKNGADVKTAGESGITPLHAAVFDAELTRIPIDAGADVNAASATGATPLMGAVRRAGNEAVVGLLLKAGANANAVAGNQRQPAIRNALAAGNASIIRQLLEHGADVKVVPAWGNLALQAGCMECMRMLIEKGVQPTVQMVAEAAAPRSLEMVKVLVEAGAPVNGQDARGYSPLMRAALSIIRIRN